MPTVKPPKPTAPQKKLVKAPSPSTVRPTAPARKTVAKPAPSANIENAESLTKEDINDAVEIAATEPVIEQPVEIPKSESNGFSFKPIRRGKRNFEELSPPKPIQLPAEEAVIAPANPIPKPETKATPVTTQAPVASPKKAATVINTPPPVQSFPKPGTKIPSKAAAKPPINMNQKKPVTPPRRPQPAEDEEYVMTKEGINAMISTIVNELSERFVTKKEVDAVVRESLQTMMLNKIKK